MLTTNQVRRIFKMSQENKSQEAIGLKVGCCPKTVRKYQKECRLPEEIKKPHTWKTRRNPFEDYWDSEIEDLLINNPGLEAKTIFDYLQREHNNIFQFGQLRTLQRLIKNWRISNGPGKEVFFPQEHYPGDLCASDFTRMNELNITISGNPFVHMLFHFVLTYSNWEAYSICFSESFESLSAGLQDALWKLGGVPKRHRTDSLSSAVINLGEGRGEFTKRYQELLDYYNLVGEHINPGQPNENGDSEQSHRRIKNAVDQALMLRGHRDFDSQKEYESFLDNIFAGRNKARATLFNEELPALKELPERTIDACKIMEARVSRSSVIRVLHNAYSVNSRLIGETVRVKAFSRHLEVWHGQKMLETIPRLSGEDKYRINYQHIISWLIRKPGAFENYKYRSELFPSSVFRIAYDHMKKEDPKNATKQYLEILKIAADSGEQKTEKALHLVISADSNFCPKSIQKIIDAGKATAIPVVCIEPPALEKYDSLLEVCHE